MDRKSVLRITATGLAVLSASTALADPQITERYDFGGPYIGGSMGWNGSLVKYGAPSLNGTVDRDSFSAGVVAGWNYRYSQNFIIGVQGDFNVLNATNSSTINGTNISTKTTWESFEVVRVGWVVDPHWLVYGMGGLAIANQTVSVPGLSDSATRVGAVLGVGLEYAIPGTYWNLQLQAALSNYGKHTFIGDEPTNLCAAAAWASLVTHYGKSK